MSQYLVKIKPIEQFFFGVEKIGNLGNRKSYFLQTAEFPQQTSILGLLRHILLLNIENKNLPELIGEQSFSSDNKNGYGIIENISPVFIIDKNNVHFFIQPSDWQFQYVENHLNCKTSYGVNKKDFIPQLSGYDAKKSIEPYLIGSNGDSVPLWYNSKTGKGVLRKCVNPGTQKNPERFIENDDENSDEDKNAAKKEAFYLQEFLYMEKEYSYACLVSLNTSDDTDKILKEHNAVVPFGGERSAFQITFEKIDEHVLVKDYINNKQCKRACWKIELLSDAYVSSEILKFTSFAISDSVGFRYINTTIKTENYSKILTKQEKMEKQKESGGLGKHAYFSNQFQLLKRGSVLFFSLEKDMQEAERLLDSEECSAYKNIGYNYYRKIIIT